MIDFTVLIPVYNTNPIDLIECVYSVHWTNQTIKQEYDIVLVDDGSDYVGTLNALEFIKQIKGVKVYRKEQNGGTSSALNLGHALIKTNWIAIQGSSDVSLPNRFELQVNHLKDNPDIDVLGTNLYSFRESDFQRLPIYKTTHKYITTLEETTLEEITEGWLTNHGTVMYKNQSIKDVGGYMLAGRRQDVDLWKRMYKAGYKIRTLEPITYAWRKAGV